MSITEYGCHNSKCTQGLPLCNGAASIKEGRPDGAAAIKVGLPAQLQGLPQLPWWQGCHIYLFG